MKRRVLIVLFCVFSSCSSPEYDLTDDALDLVRALDLHKMEYGQYPDSESFSALVATLGGGNERKLLFLTVPEKLTFDGEWKAIDLEEYFIAFADGDRFFIGCSGEDGKFNTEDDLFYGGKIEREED